MPSRKAFLAVGTIAAVGTSLLPESVLADATAATTSTPDSFGYAFDLRAFFATANRPTKHRHLFASTQIDSGEVLYAMLNTKRAYAQMGVKPTDVHLAAVLYHGLSIAMAMNDETWNKLIIPGLTPRPKWLKKNFPDVILGAGNPYFLSALETDDAGVAPLSAIGTSFFICNNALRAMARTLASKLGLTHVQTYRGLTAGLPVSATVVPAGVWAIHALQEQRFTLLQTSL